MAKKKEQLEEAVEEISVEEKPVEEVTETSNEESTKESTEETIEEVDELEVDEEQLRNKIDIKETKEELIVIKEVRDELVNLYTNYKEVEQLKNESVSENESLNSQVEKLSTELHTYKVAEEKLEAEMKLQKLEQLSAKFRTLGQEKTVEQLSVKDAETLAEFEKIVDAALSKIGETAEMPAVTTTSYTEQVSEALSEEEKTSEDVAEVPKEQLREDNFFKNIAAKLTGEQISSNRDRAAQF